jgi:branched-chain amino acid aminotransferase
MATEGIVYVNGEWSEPDDARISVFDSGFIGGVAVFDTLACWEGRIFKLGAHLERFRRSTHAAGIPLREAGASLEDAVIETVRRSELREAYVQVIATRGKRLASSEPPGEPTLIVYAIPYIWIASEEKRKAGISVVIPAIRNTPSTSVDPKIKNFNRMHQYLARQEAQLAGADDVVMLDSQGRLTEAPGANLFVVQAGALLTPAEGVLRGITRATVFEIAEEFRIPASAGDLTPYDLYTADEAFLCTTAGGIIPIARADGRAIGSGAPGPLTQRIHDRYWERHLSGPDTTVVFE